MSVAPISGPDPAAYSYPSSLPSALASPGSVAGSPTAAAGSSSSAPPLSAYQTEYDTLQQDDAEELMQVSLGSAANAQSNVASVLAQAAALQSQQLAAQQQQNLASADAAVQSSPPSTTGSTAASDPLNLPTLQSLFDQSDSTASTNLNTYSSSGSSIDLLA